MTVLLDAAAIAPADRTDALRAALDSAIVPSLVLLDDVEGGPLARVETWEMGAGTTLLDIATTGCRLSRSPRHVRAAAPERVSVSLPRRGLSLMSQSGTTWSGEDGELRLLDLARPYAFRQIGTAASQAVYIDHERLQLPLGLVGRAAPRLPASPVYEVTRSHLLQLRAAAGAVQGQPAGALLAEATVALVRALVVSAAQDDVRTRESLAQTLLVRATTVARQRLADPRLDPSGIAAATGVSLRRLHRVFSDEGTTVWEWVLRERLEGARRDLAEDRAPFLTVAAVAHRWGFVDARHFARRFRRAYGVSPVEWRRSGVRPESPGTADGS